MNAPRVAADSGRRKISTRNERPIRNLHQTTCNSVPSSRRSTFSTQPCSLKRNRAPRRSSGEF